MIVNIIAFILFVAVVVVGAEYYIKKTRKWGCNP